MSKIISTSNKFPSRAIELALSLLPPTAVCLDLGCGLGRDALALIRHGCAVTAVDKDQESLTELRQQADQDRASKLEIVHDDVGHYEIANDKYDLINCQNVFPFLTNDQVEKLVTDMKIKVKNGGYLAISAFTVQDPSRQTDRPLKYYLPSQQLRRWFEDWAIIFYLETKVIDPPHRGAPKPHQHYVARILARQDK